MSELLTQRPVPRTRFELVVYTRHQSQLFPLAAGAIVGIGRGPDNAIQLDDASVSRQHARLYVGDEVEVEDLGSANGTTLVRSGDPSGEREDTHSSINQRLDANQRVSLFPGDVLRIGVVVVTLQRRGRSSLTGLKASPQSIRPSIKPAKEAGPPVLADPEMQRAYELAIRAAASDISILLLGETGVGKEVMAETIHRRSPRVHGAFLRLNCAALPEGLLESELFGHERGAFTGAHAAKAGLLESTDGGTVFLDEIGELPLGTQSKLLRVLEERTVIRLGATKPRLIDVRFVTATNRDLGREVRAGRFRGDLYYRICGLVIRIPPLRERKNEIEALALHFLRDFCARAGQPEPRFTEAAVEILRNYEWPGNVRELRNVMERATLLASDGVIAVEQVLLDSTRPEELFDADELETPTKVFTPSVKPPESGPEDERDRVIRSLEACGGNQTRAAKMLGMSRRTLINRLEQFSLPRPKKG